MQNMLRIAAALLVLTVACYGSFPNVGGYTDRPELVDDRDVLSLTSFAAEYLGQSQNLFLKQLKVVRVQTQVVSGLNYKIDFTAEPVNGVNGQKTTCQVVIYVRFDTTKTVTQSQCQTS